jgi:hypothetical protein
MNAEGHSSTQSSIICPACERAIDANDNFCSYCGANLESHTHRQSTATNRVQSPGQVGLRRGSDGKSSEQTSKRKPLRFVGLSLVLLLIGAGIFSSFFLPQDTTQPGLLVQWKPHFLFADLTVTNVGTAGIEIDDISINDREDCTTQSKVPDAGDLDHFYDDNDEPFHIFPHITMPSDIVLSRELFHQLWFEKRSVDYLFRMNKDGKYEGTCNNRDHCPQLGKIKIDFVFSSPQTKISPASGRIQYVAQHLSWKHCPRDGKHKSRFLEL